MEFITLSVWLVTCQLMSLKCIVVVCLVTFLHVFLHSCMLSFMYHSCMFDFKNFSFTLDHTCLCICVDDCASLMHVNICMWSSV